MAPSAVSCSLTLTTYSPSAVNMCVAARPPCVPSGRPSRWAFCDMSGDTRYIRVTGAALASPTRERADVRAADR